MLTDKQRAYWQRRLDMLRLFHALLRMPKHTLWCVGSMEDGPFARLVLPNPDGGYTGGYREAFADTPAEAIDTALATLRASNPDEEGKG